jgi:hypothetical protein
MNPLTVLVAAWLILSAASCATLKANSARYRSLPDPCAGKVRWGQDPLCGAPAP